MKSGIRNYFLPAVPLSFVVLVFLSNLADDELGSLLDEGIVVAGLLTCLVALYLWIDRTAAVRRVRVLEDEKRGLEELVARKQSLETDLEVTSAVRELSLVTGNTNDQDLALATSARLTHDLVFDVAGNRAGVEVAILLGRPELGRPELRATATGDAVHTGRKARPRNLTSSIPEGAIAVAAGGEHQPPRLRQDTVSFFLPLESTGGSLGALFVSLPRLTEESEEDVAHLDQLLRRFSSHIGHAIQKFALYDEATLDALTGLLTKRQYLQRISEVSSDRRAKGSMSLIVCDLDHFKLVNDNHGHATGDAVLKKVAKVILKVIRSGDMAYRFGGEEIVVLTPQGLRGATALSERVRKAIGETTVKSSKGVVVTMSASLGVAELEPEITGEQLFERADKAVYESKEKGRNRTSVWTTSGLTPAGELPEGGDGTTTTEAVASA